MRWLEGNVRIKTKTSCIKKQSKYTDHVSGKIYQWVLVVVQWTLVAVK